MSTALKLWLGFGLLVLIMVGSGLFVARRLALIEGALTTIMAVQEPATAATYGMSVNVSSTVSAVLAYVESSNPELRARPDTLEAEFDRLKDDFDHIAQTQPSRTLGAQIADAHRRFNLTGDTLLALTDERRQDFENHAHATDAVIALLERLSPGLDDRSHDDTRREALAKELESHVGAIGTALAHFLRTRDPRYRALMGDHEAQFHDALQRYQQLHVDDATRALTFRAGRMFDDYAARGRVVMDRVLEMRAVEGRFLDLDTFVERLVREGIHSLARTDLVEAQLLARRSIHTSLVVVLLLLVAGIVIGSATAIPTGRSIVRDEARIREQREQLRARMEELSAAHRRKDEFLGVLSHELRNPLAPLSNALHILEPHDATLPNDVRVAHDLMRRQVRNISRLVDDLLDVSRINEGRITLRREEFDMGAICAEVAEDLRPAATARRHQLELRLPSRGPWVSADPTRLAQIVSNLLFNAIKYTPDGGHIRLELEQTGKQATLRVQDDGIGISPLMCTRIFEPFVQGDAPAARQQGGLGIGLTLVRRLVELHDGRVEAFSAGQGTGSTFTVRLPALEREPAIAAPPPSPAGDPTPRRVLVVDDNRDAAETLSTLLGLWGHQVRIAHDGPSAIATADASPPEVILLDIDLPGMDGHEVARHLREDPRTSGAKIVALTGFGQDSDRARALAAGFDEHVTKPVDPEVLRDVLARPRG